MIIMLSTTATLRVLTNPVISRTLISSSLIGSLALSRNLMRSYSSFNRQTMLMQENTKRYKSSIVNEQQPEMNIENAMFTNLKMSQVELENYNHGMRLKYLKEQLDEQKSSIESLEKAVNEYKSNFL